MLAHLEQSAQFKSLSPEEQQRVRDYYSGPAVVLPWLEQTEEFKALSPEKQNKVRTYYGQGAEEAPGQWNPAGAVADVGKLLYDIPVQTKGALGHMFEEDDPLAQHDWKDRWREEAEARTEERSRDLKASGTGNQRVLPGTDFLQRKDIVDTSASSGFSLAAMTPALASRAAWAIPGVGPVVGTAMGLLGSGAAAYKMDKSMFTGELLKKANADMVRLAGRGMTADERASFLDATADVRNDHAMWEAGPEAVGNAIGAIGLGKIFTGIAKKSLATAVGGYLSSMAGELSTETVTQTGQQRAESAVGLTPDAPRSFLSGEDWQKSFDEIAPVTALQTTLMGGGSAILGKSYDAVASKIKTPEDTAKEIDNAVKQTADKPGIEAAQDMAEVLQQDEQALDATSFIPYSLQAELKAVMTEGLNDIQAKPLEQTVTPSPVGQALQSKREAFKGQTAEDDLPLAPKMGTMPQQDAERIAAEMGGAETQTVDTPPEAPPISDLPAVDKELVAKTLKAIKEADANTIERMGKNMPAFIGDNPQYEPYIKVFRQEIFKRKRELAGGVKEEQMVSSITKGEPVEQPLQERIGGMDKGGLEMLLTQLQQMEESGEITSEERIDAGLAIRERLKGLKESEAETTPARISKALGKTEQVDTLEQMGVTGEEQQIDAIVRDAVGQKVEAAKALKQRGKDEVADRLLDEARHNGEIIKEANGEVSDRAVDEALAGVEGDQVGTKLGPSEDQAASVGVKTETPSLVNDQNRGNIDSKRKGKPRLAEDGDTLWSEFSRLSKEGIVNSERGGIVYPVAQIVGDPNQFAWKSGKLVKVTNGGMGTVKATTAEADDFHNSLTRDRVEIFTVSGWGGAGSDNASKRLATLHSPSGLDFRGKTTISPSQTNIDDVSETPTTQVKPEQPKPQASGSPPSEGEGSKPGAVTDYGSKKKGEKEPEIEDFGEKIGGARKDLYTNTLKDAKLHDTATVPLSKSFPESKYDKMLEEGVDAKTLALVRSMRDEIPIKPRQTWKKKQWVRQVIQLRDFSEQILSGEISIDKLIGKLEGSAVLKDKVLGRAELYEEFGHDKSLKGITFGKHHYSLYNGEKNVTKWTIEKKGKASAFSNWPTELGVGNTKEEALASFRARYDSLGEKKKRSKRTTFNIYQYRRDDKKYWIGKKVGRGYIDLKSFDSSKEAAQYLKDHREVIEKILEKRKYVPAHRREANEERVGKDHRKGADVTPEMFTEAFGFRGVEFGNWVKATGERQASLNRAYDALADLADLLNIPTQAISLNGELGLAFGARGKGGKRPAAAHYESNKVVINLTRKAGAGTLAHEWLHAVDHHFIKQRQEPEGMRSELSTAWEGLLSGIKNTEIKKRSMVLDKVRSKPYWSLKSEMLARTFENYVIEKLGKVERSNDYLANIVTDQEYMGDLADEMADNILGEDYNIEDSYPYLKEEEKAGVIKAYDKFFKTVKTKTTDKGTTLYSKGDATSTPTNIESELTAKLGNLRTKQLLKKVVILDTQADAERVAGEKSSQADSTRDSKYGLVQGFVKDGTIHLVRDGIAEGKALPVLLHELAHTHLPTMYGEAGWQKIQGTFDRYAKAKNAQGEAIRAAQAQVPKDTDPVDVAEEGITYYIENEANSSQPLYKRIVAYVKDFLARMGFSSITSTMTPQDIVTVIQARAKRGTVGETAELVKYSRASGQVVAKQSATLKRESTRSFKRAARMLARGSDKYLGSISTRLGNINEKLKARFRRLDFNIGTGQTKDVEAVEPLLRKAKREMSAEDFVLWDTARKNGDVAVIGDLVEKYGMEQEYLDYRNKLEQIFEEAEGVGLDVGWLDEYAPRVIKDPEGFLEEIGKGPEWDTLSRALREQAKSMEMTVAQMPIELKADLVATIFLRQHGGISKPGHVKNRAIKKIPPNLEQFYMDSDSALVHYIHQMRKNIEYRKFFGRTPTVINKAKRGLAAAKKARSKENKKTNPDQAKVQKYHDLVEHYQGVLDRYKVQTRDYTDSISAYIVDLLNKGEIKPGDENVLIDIFNARFHEHGTRGLVQAYKNLSYIDTMGSPISALTQIGDLAWSLYENGFWLTAKHSIRSAKGKAGVTRQDVGIDRIAQEFADSDTFGNMVSKVFKWVGLEKMDSIGKEAMLNAALEKYQKKASQDPAALRGEIKHIFEGEVEGVIEDLESGEVSENVRLLVYSKLLDYQPAALSEMPEQYLRAGNGRLFYMLKTYTLKMFDVYRNEAYSKIKNGDKAEKIQGLKNLVMLSMFLVMANAGADELKDFVLGRKTDLQDRVTDNILRLFGVSKYVTWKARTEGVGSAIVKQMLPPFKFVDSLSKDVATAGDDKGLEVLGSVPVIGKVAYWHFGRGKHKRDDLWSHRLRREKRALNNIKNKVEKDPSLRGRYRRQLIRLRRANRLQGQLNKIQRKINRLEEAGNNKPTIKKLKARREEMIKVFLSKA